MSLCASAPARTSAMRRTCSVLASVLIGAGTALAQLPGRPSSSVPVPGAAGPLRLAPPAPLPPLAAQVTHFNYRLANVTWEEGRWVLRAGDVFLKDFGRREAEAREALRIIRDLRLTEHGTL